MRHLLVWCANRAKSSTSKTQSSSGIPLPPLSQQGAQVVQDVQTRLIQLLAEGKISTPVSSESLNANAPANLKEHPQNAKNRVQEDTLLKHLNQYRSPRFMSPDSNDIFAGRNRNSKRGIRLSSRTTPSASLCKRALTSRDEWISASNPRERNEIFCNGSHGRMNLGRIGFPQSKLRKTALSNAQTRRLPSRRYHPWYYSQRRLILR
jgi:hypothetical protein